MNGLHLSLLLACIIWVTQSYFIREEKQEKLSSGNVVCFPEILPITIVDLKKASQKVNRENADKKKMVKAKKKDVPKKKPRTPPPNCVPLNFSCKPLAPPCCEPCAFCQCLFFKTVCIYKMGYPYC